MHEPHTRRPAVADRYPPIRQGQVHHRVALAATGTAGPNVRTLTQLERALRQPEVFYIVPRKYR